MSELQRFADLPKVVYHARRSRELGKLASACTGKQAQNAMQEKIAADTAIVALLEKVAAFNLGQRLGKLWESRHSPLGKALQYGTGAAVPVAATGAYLMHRKGEEEEKRYTNLMGKAMKALPWAVGIGAGALGLSQVGKAIDARRNIATNTALQQTGYDQQLKHEANRAMLQRELTKRGSDDAPDSDVKIAEKIAAAAKTYQTFYKVSTEHGDASVRKRAEYGTIVARAHIADLVGDLLL